MKRHLLDLSSCYLHSPPCHSFRSAQLDRHSLISPLSKPRGYSGNCYPRQPQRRLQNTIEPRHLEHLNSQSPTISSLSPPLAPHSGQSPHRNVLRGHSNTLNIVPHPDLNRYSYLGRSSSLLHGPGAYIKTFPRRYPSSSYAPLLTTSFNSIIPTTSTTFHQQDLTTYTMTKQLSSLASDSSLSPPPDNLMSTANIAVNDKKRKAETNPRTRKTTVQYAEVDEADVGLEDSPRPKRRAAKKVKTMKELSEEESEDVKVTPKKTAPRRNKKAAVEEADQEETVKVAKKAPKPKASKAVKDQTPFAERTKSTETGLTIGAHVSTAGGVHNAITNLVMIGGNAFAMFMKNHRKWDSIPLDPAHATAFIQGCKDNNINPGECCLPHGSYLVNLAHPDPARKKQAYDSFLEDLTRCQKLGIKLYNFHPGNANATTREEGIRVIADNLNQAHQDPATGDVITVLETMASFGNTIGGTFEDLAAIIKLVKDKTRVGVCLDTCHVFAAGYDLRTPATYASTMSKFDKIIGLEYLKAFHINDSKAPLSSNRDLHARIGTGYLGLQAFHNLMNDTRFHGLPMVLETPVDTVDADGKKTEDKGIWAREIKLLESLVGMDTSSKTFLDLSAKLQDEGTAERERIAEQVDKKAAKDAKPKKKRVAKKKLESEEE